MMVSILWIIPMSLAMAQAPPAVASHSSPPPSGFRDEPKPAQPAAQPPKPAAVITPEMRGDILMARKMYREAAEAYKEGPKDSAVLLNKTGIAYHQMLELGPAEKYYRLAVKVNREYSEAINNLGTVYYARKGYRRAIGEYRKALRINPKSASIWSNLGMGYFARKDYKLAEESWQKAMALDPDVFENHGTQGVLLQERSVEERAKFHYFLAQGYAKKGQNDRALLYIRKALEEGFKDRKKLQEDPAFAALQDLDEFKQLLALEPRVL
jgi:tetratricopeptide (TPR) repeat protein